MERTIISFIAISLFSIGAQGQEVIVQEGNLRLNDSTLYLRPGLDLNYGLGWFGSGKLFDGENVDGPVIFGNSGGALGINAGGTETIALRWNATGNVGVGTNAPVARLMVMAPGANPLLSDMSSNGLIRLLGDGATGYIDIGKMSSSPWAGWMQAGIDTSTTDPFSLQPLGGNVGIGTTSPTTVLDVNGSIRMRNGASDGFIPVGDANGVMTWTDPNLVSAPDPLGPVPIRFQGNVLFVHPADNGSGVDWGVELATGATSLTDGAGNTAAIIAMGAAGATAAGICDTLTAFGFNDWYLPAQYELDAIYKQSYLITGLQLNADWEYWSSTEIDDLTAWAHRLDYGGPDQDAKVEVNHNVRCVRRE